MEEFSRLYLYSYLKRKIDNAFFSENIMNIDVLTDLLEFDIKMLSNIESEFLYNSGSSEKLNFDNQFRKNLKLCEKQDELFSKLGITRDMKEKMSNEVLKKRRLKNTAKLNDYKFNALVNFLNDINKSVIKNINLKDIALVFFNQYKEKTKNKVFLSYAYDDKLYTLPLFINFLNHGIFLYVDWIFNNREKDGRKIKESLITNLRDSSQLLFLRSTKSELAIPGNGKGSSTIRGWCSWELGSFYTQGKSNEKYYTNIYRLPNKHLTQLDGIKPLHGIDYGRLY